MAIDNAVLMLVLGALAGSMVFFALVVAPKVFQALPPDHAGAFLRSFFPSYYLWGLLLAMISALIALWSNAILSLACAIVAVLFAYARQILMPKINTARDAQLRRDTEAGKRFNRLHINGAQLLTLVGVAAGLVWMPLPG